MRNATKPARVFDKKRSPKFRWSGTSRDGTGNLTTLSRLPYTSSCPSRCCRTLSALQRRAGCSRIVACVVGSLVSSSGAMPPQSFGRSSVCDEFLLLGSQGGAFSDRPKHSNTSCSPHAATLAGDSSVVGRSAGKSRCGGGIHRAVCPWCGDLDREGDEQKKTQGGFVGWQSHPFSVLSSYPVMQEVR